MMNGWAQDSDGARMNAGVTFRHRFLPAFGAISGCTLPIAALAAELDFGIMENPWKTAALLLFTAALAAVLTSVWSRMPVTVSPEGLRCYAFSGNYQFVRWEEMKWVRPTRMMLGMPYLRIGVDGGRSPIWLPMFLVDMSQFAILVSSHAGPGHIVTVALSRMVRS